MVGKKNKKLKSRVKKDVAKVFNKEGRYRSMLLKMNPYALSLASPCEYPGIKIPDLNTMPSATFQIIDRRTLTVNAQGVCGVLYGDCGNGAGVPSRSASLIPVNWAAIGSSDTKGGKGKKSSVRNCYAKNEPEVPGITPYGVGMTLASDATVSNLLGNTDMNVFTFDQWNSQDVGVPSVFQKARLVSAESSIRYLGTPLNSKGKYTAAFAPRRQFQTQLHANGVVPPLGLSSIQALPTAKTRPINDLVKGGIKVLYEPQDSRSLNYVDLRATYDSETLANVGDDTAQEDLMGGQLWLVVDGATPTDSVEVVSYFNYEGIPFLGSFNVISASSSPSDSIALDQGLNMIRDVPKVSFDTSHYEGILSSARAPVDTSSMNVTSSQEKQGASMFEKIMGGIDSAESLYQRAKPYIEQATPLVEELLSAL